MSSFAQPPPRERQRQDCPPRTWSRVPKVVNFGGNPISPAGWPPFLSRGHQSQPETDLNLLHTDLEAARVEVQRRKTIRHRVAPQAHRHAERDDVGSAIGDNDGRV